MKWGLKSDLNPADSVFSKVKNALNFDLSSVVHYDIKLAVNEAVDLVSSNNMHYCMQINMKIFDIKNYSNIVQIVI